MATLAFNAHERDELTIRGLGDALEEGLLPISQGARRATDPSAFTMNSDDATVSVFLAKAIRDPSGDHARLVLAPSMGSSPVICDRPCWCQR